MQTSTPTKALQPVAPARMGRVARTIPGPRLLQRAMTDSANDASLTSPQAADSSALLGAGRSGDGPAVPAGAAPDAYALHQAARIGRAWLVADLAAVLASSVGERFSKWLEARRQAAEARATYAALAELDAWTLRDLGLHRSELKSVAYSLAHGYALEERRGLR